MLWESLFPQAMVCDVEQRCGKQHERQKLWGVTAGNLFISGDVLPSHEGERRWMVLLHLRAELLVQFQVRLGQFGWAWSSLVQMGL